MPTHIYNFVVAILAGLCGGIALGIIFLTQTEVRKRELQVGIAAAQVSRSRMFFARLLAMLLAVLKGLPSLAIVPLIFYIGGVRYSREITWYLGLTYLFGCASGKYTRYLYWKAR